jgi:hypothetical protein
MVVNYEDSLCHVAQLAHQDALELPNSLKHAKMAKEMGELSNNWCGPKRKLLEEMIKTDRAKRQQTRRGLF